MILLFLVLVVAKAVLGIRLVRVEITPSVAVMDESVWLNCTYDLEGDELYAVKWYKNDVEFYRYIPSSFPSVRPYLMPGILINKQTSYGGNVQLMKTNLSSEGTYRCEVSAEAPTFQTVRKEEQLYIHVLPKDNPKIIGIEEGYKVGDMVNLTCTSGPAKPPPDLGWFINGIEAPKESQSRTIAVPYPDNLQSTLKKISFTIEPGQFKNGPLTIRCSAIYSQAHAKGSQEIIFNEKLNTEAPDIYQKHVYGYQTMDFTKLNTTENGYRSDGPTISGRHQYAYEVGDHVDVNCTSPPTKPAAQLQWLINQKPVDSKYLIYYLSNVYHDGYESSTLGLSFFVRKEHFTRKQMRLKCQASMTEVVRTMNSEQLIRNGFHQQPGLLVSAHSSKAGTLSSFESSCVCVIFLLISIRTLLSLTLNA